MHAVRLPLLILLLHLAAILAVGSAGASCGGDAVCVEDNGRDEPDVFDAFARWVDERSNEGQKFLHQLLGPSSGDSQEGDQSKSFFDEIKDAFTQEGEDSIENKIRRGVSKLKDFVDESFAQFDQKGEQGSGGNEAFEFLKSFQSVFSATGEAMNDEESIKLAADFIAKASELSQFLQSNKAKRGFLEMKDVILRSLGEVRDSLERNFGHVQWDKFKMFSAIYFLEHMESLLTPSMKRRKHAFAPDVSTAEVVELHKALYLANLAYEDTVADIKEGLQLESSEWELIYAQLKNAPGEPAHYIALRKDHSLSSSLARHDYLDVLLVVRGTKDLSDVLSDGLLDAVPFRGGFGHAGLVQSGQFLVDHHIDLFHSLLKMANKERVKLTIIGHSLGAGAASIAAIIFNEDQEAIDANVVGFGCPSLLSKELSESTREYVTTIISDADMIPRLSGPTLVNAALDVMSYDWIERALTDLRDGVEFLRSKLPFDIPGDHIESVYAFVKKLLEHNVRLEIRAMSSVEREQVLLIPPGKCTHFYRDGQGVTGDKVPCDFFDSLEISRTMIDDHLIGIGYNRMLLDYMRHRLEDYQFTFEQKIV